MGDQNKQPFLDLENPKQRKRLIIGVGVFISLCMVAMLVFKGYSEFTDGQELRLDLASISDKKFDIHTASILFIAKDYHQRSQLYLFVNESVEQLTREPSGILDYSVSPDRSLLIYSTENKMDGTDLWLFNPNTKSHGLLLSCPNSKCWQVIWAHESDKVLYSRVDLTQENIQPSTPTIWWLDLTNGETNPIFGSSQLPIVTFSWSWDGDWLAYTSPLTNRIEIRNLLNGQGKSIPTTIKTGINWSPNSESVLYLDNISTKGYYFPRIFRFDINDEIIIPITYGSQYNEYAPEWSPDAYLIAFIRQDLINEGADINDQIWLMDSNGDNQKPVTHDEDTIHGAPNWSPDGKYLLFPYFSRKDNISKIGYINIQTGDFYHVITGKSPAWNP